MVTEIQPERAATRHSLIELANVEKVYRMGKVDYRALRGVRGGADRPDDDPPRRPD